MNRGSKGIIAVMGFLLPTSGCVSPEVAIPSPTPSATPTALATVAVLRSTFPTLTPGDQYRVIRERDGAVTRQIIRGKEAIFSLTIMDVSQERALISQMFPPNGPRRNGFPVGTAGMGGVAILVKNRYRIQVQPMAPTATDTEQDRLLFGFRATELPE